MSKLIEGFYQDEDPCLTFTLEGPSSDSLQIESVCGVIDTGFTGFVQIPDRMKDFLNLQIEGAAESSLADGSKRDAPWAEVKAILSKDTVVGPAVISEADEVLVGMGFLREFRKALVIARKHIWLINEDDFYGVVTNFRKSKDGEIPSLEAITT